MNQECGRDEIFFKKEAQINFRNILEDKTTNYYVVKERRMEYCLTILQPMCNA